MGISIEQYRARIGSFLPVRNVSNKSYEKQEYSRSRKSKSFFNCVKVLLMMCIAVFLFEAELNNFQQDETFISVAEKHNLLSLTFELGGRIIRGRSLNICQLFIKHEDNFGRQFYQFTNLDNHFSKYTNGNRKSNGIRIYHFNKGSSFLANGMHEIENIIIKHRPHLLGISESNFFRGHDYDNVQIENYKFITAKTLENEDLKVSRVCVYLHNSMVGKIREDLMDENFSSIWLEVGLPQKRKILVGNAYREWGFMRQVDPSVSRDLAAQKERWSIFLGQ
jgi:hypothetical protein